MMAPMKDSDYTERLLRLQEQRWKQVFAFANPYGLHIRSIVSGATLEVGCGIGRVLNFLPRQMVGVDRNADSVSVCRDKGLEAYLPAEFESRYRGRQCFGTLLLSHVVEHMSTAEAIALVQSYRPYLESKARLVLIAPQEKGFASDSTHVEFMDFDRLAAICAGAGFAVQSAYSFPFVRSMGRHYIYNEFVTIGKLL